MTGPTLLTPAEAAAVLGVDTKNVGRNAERHGLRIHWTPGGHRRYDAAEIRALAERRARERAW